MEITLQNVRFLPALANMRRCSTCYRTWPWGALLKWNRRAISLISEEQGHRQSFRCLPLSLPEEHQLLEPSSLADPGNQEAAGAVGQQHPAAQFRQSGLVVTKTFILMVRVSSQGNLSSASPFIQRCKSITCIFHHRTPAPRWFHLAREKMDETQMPWCFWKQVQ